MTSSIIFTARLRSISSSANPVFTKRFTLSRVTSASFPRSSVSSTPISQLSSSPRAGRETGVVAGPDWPLAGLTRLLVGLDRPLAGLERPVPLAPRKTVATSSLARSRRTRASVCSSLAWKAPNDVALNLCTHRRLPIPAAAAPSSFLSVALSLF